MNMKVIDRMGRILVVEDDVDLNETYVDLLENEGYDVISVSDSIQAMDNLIRSRQVPDVVIKADKNFVELHFPYGWLDQHPLTQADLGKEFDYLKDANITLLFD